MDNKELHEKILYPVVRVRGERGGGSGVLIYSQPDSHHNGQYINLVFTCEHVVDGSIRINEEWDPVLKRDRKQDIFESVMVDVFDYDDSKVVSANTTKADIIAYDRRQDLAVLQLANVRKMPYIAEIYPKDKIEALHLFDEIWISGCSLLHDPFASAGTLTYLKEIIDQKSYLMANAPSVFGNSGGGLFYGQTGALLGLTSRVTALQLGFGVDVMTWMEFSTHPERIYEFLEHQELQFVYDQKDDYYKAKARREQRQKEAMRELLLTKAESHTSSSEEG